MLEHGLIYLLFHGMMKSVVRELVNKVPEETIEKIKSSVDIVDIVGEYVQLKKRGRNFFGLCPFHGERTPSFSVATDKQIYYCFGCQNGGNVFSFLMEIEGYSFLEAVAHLGEKTGVDLPELNPDGENSERKNDRRAMLQAHELLVQYYHSCLLKTNAGAKALDYLQKRGFNRDTIEMFRLGYAPAEWDRAVNFLTKRGFSAAVMQKAGLFSKREFDGKYFDRFRDRIMFPLRDPRGRPIAFGGRVLGDGNPKYMNSPESAIFNKGKTLYGLHLARAAIREKKQAVLFEGNIDVTRGHQAGFPNTVATLGTSLTLEQAYLLRRQAESVVVCYDSDNAGIDAAFRAADILTEAGCYVKIATIPDGLDPDDYIGKFGAKRFGTDIIGASQTVTAFKMQYHRRGKNLQDEGDQLRYIEEVLQVIAGLNKAVERDHYLRQLAGEFSLSLDALKRQQYQTYKQIQKKGYNSGQSSNNNALNRNLLQRTLLPAYQNAERILLAYMMTDRQIAEKVRTELGGSFDTDEYSAIAAHLYAYYSEGHSADVSSFIQRLDNGKLVQTATEIAMLPLNADVSEEELSDYINRVRNYPRWVEIEKMEQQRKVAEGEQNAEEAARIQMQILEKKKEMKDSVL